MKTRSTTVITWGIVALTISLLVVGAWLLIARFTRPHTTVTVGATSITADLARSDDELERGLSGITSLASNHGMLFVFTDDGPHAMWMKDMKIDLDMVWINADRRVVTIQRNVKASSYPTTYRSTEPSRYVLEIPAGGAQQASIATGQIASFDLP